MADQPADPTILALATVGITARDSSDTVLVLEALTGKKFAHKGQKTDMKQIGVVTNFGSDESVRKGFETAVDVFRKRGYQLVDVTAPFSENPDMQHIEENRKTANTELFKDIDVMILPTTAAVVPKIDTVGEDPPGFITAKYFLCNLFCITAISIPCGFDEHGLPLGLQIVGKQNGDADVLKVAQAFEQVAPWGDRHPDL